MSNISYDARCAELARLFLAQEELDTPQRVKALAQNIQQAIEDYIAEALSPGGS